MGTGDINDRFGQIVTKYVVQSGMRDDIETLTPARLAHELGLSSESVSEVRKVMNGTAGKPSTTKMARYFKILHVSEEDQNYVHGIGLPPMMDFSELVTAIQASDDFGLGESNERNDIRDKKIRARIAFNNGEMDKANQLAAEVEEIQRQTHFYAKNDLAQSAESLVKTIAFRGSAALQIRNFETAFEFYSQIPNIDGLPGDVAEKFSHSIRVSYNAYMAVQIEPEAARAILEKMLDDKVTPNVVSYNTLLTFLNTEEEVRAVFEEMRENNVTPNEVSYNTLLTFLNTEEEVRTVFKEMRENNVTPNVVSYTTLVAKCESLARGERVAAEFKEAFPDVASPEISNAVISLANDFEEALQAANRLLSMNHFVGRGEFNKVFSYPITHLSASQLMKVHHDCEFSFDTSLESPINQYRKIGQIEYALQLALFAPYVGAAQRFYREEYELCAAHFNAELADGNDEDNVHYAYGIAACLNADWEPARRHLAIALERCFPRAPKRRAHIESLIEQIPD